MNLPIIDYQKIKPAIEFYRAKGFRYIEVPWLVSHTAINITCPKTVEKYLDGFYPVASGEQSFLELALSKAITNGKYVCVTPCFRPEDRNRSKHHFEQFFKVELIHLGITQRDYYFQELVQVALEFHNDAVQCQCVETVDEPRWGCETIKSYDIKFEDLEVGSYGIRVGSGFTWIYGTGMALPRYENLLLKSDK